MRILMLGWEFPPYISGGLGTACHGLTKALARMGQRVLFVLPKPVEPRASSHVTMLTPALLREPGAMAEALEPDELLPEQIGEETRTVESVDLFRLPMTLSTDYGGLTTIRREQVVRMQREVARLQEQARAGDKQAIERLDELRRIRHEQSMRELEEIGDLSGEYGGDLIADAHRYARLAVALARRVRFDVIHAHDWLTYPAGIAISRLTGRPLIAHVHATEFDRSGEHVNQQVYEIERAGMHAADRVITVSALTRNMCVNRYGVAPEKIEIVYNGVDREEMQPVQGAKIEREDKIVLFLGRITMQKGPEYFIAAAKRVLEKMDNVKFVVAGSGDMAMRMIEMAAALGIGHKVLFTGFLRGRDVDRVFSMADCYVMPSVSEPFGIAPLEAISHDVPVIISKQSGVAEVLTHALKVDFWDVQEMANKIVAVLRYPALSQTLREHGEFELRGLTWEGAATRCVQIYADAVASAHTHA